MQVTLKITAPSVSYYGVKGKTREQVFASLNAHGWWGRYRSNEAVAYASSKTDIDGMTVTCRAVVLLPKWTEATKASKEDQKSFAGMLKALEKHERNHHTIFEDAAKAFKKTLETGKDLPKTKAMKAWSDFTAALQKAQDAYDTRTDHGEKEGVELV
jgi:predicted secreted Zn-dependent protease